MTLQDPVIIGLIIANFIGLCVSVALLVYIARRLESTASTGSPASNLGPTAPVVTKDEVDKFVAQIKKARQERSEAYAMRGGFPAPSNTRRGRYIHTPE